MSKQRSKGLQFLKAVLTAVNLREKLVHQVLVFSFELGKIVHEIPPTSVTLNMPTAASVASPPVATPFGGMATTSLACPAEAESNSVLNSLTMRKSTPSTASTSA